MAKEKPQTQRSYDDDGYKKRAACVCVKNETESEVLLISSTRDKQRWIIPGGGIEKNENPEDAAAREVFEEAGVVGRLGRLLGVFENTERKNRTSVYLLVVDEELAEWEENLKYGRVRKWFCLDEAKSELEKHKPVQSTYLNLLKGFQTAAKKPFHLTGTGNCSSSLPKLAVNFVHFNSSATADHSPTVEVEEKTSRKSTKNSSSSPSRSSRASVRF